MYLINRGMNFPQPSSVKYLDPGLFDPTGPNTQFFPGQRITVFLPNGQMTGTFIRFIPSSTGSNNATAVIQLDNGSVVQVDISQISVATTAPFPQPPVPVPPQPSIGVPGGFGGNVLGGIIGGMLGGAMGKPGGYSGYNNPGRIQPTSREQLNAFALISNPNRFNGYRVKSPDNPAVYLIDNGKRRHIANPDVYNQLFRNWDGIHTVIDIENIPLGSTIRGGTGLFKTPKSNKVFWLDKENNVRVVKRWVTSPQAMDKYNFNWDKIATVYDYFADGIHDGSQIQ